MKIGIDIDDTMADTFDYLMPYIAQFFDVDIKYLKDNNISYSNLPKEMKKRELEFAKKYYDKIIPSTPFKPKVAEYIDKIRALGHEIIVITARDKTLYTDEYKTTIEELKNNNIHYDKLICDFDKAKVCKIEKIDLFIDDSIANCRKVNKLGIETILFSSKVNINDKTNLYRVDSWKDIYEKVKEKQSLDIIIYNQTIKELNTLIPNELSTSNNIIKKAVEYAKEFFEKDFSGHDFYHTLRVYNLSKFIAEKENGEKEIIELSALLHDVDDYKLVGEQEEKFKNAKMFLRDNNYPEEKIEKICHIISQVSFKGKDTQVPDTLEGRIVQDADRLDAIGAIGIARTFTYGGSKNRPIHIPEQKYIDKEMSAKEYYANEGTSINHFYEKLLKLKELMNTKTAKKMAEDRHKYMEQFLKEFYKEWDGSL